MVASQVKAALKNSERFTRCRLRRALQSSDISGGAETVGLPAIGVVDLIEHVDQRTGLELFAHCGNFLQAIRLAEGAQKALALRPGTAEKSSLAENDRPGIEAGQQQRDQHCDGDRSAATHHVVHGAHARKARM